MNKCINYKIPCPYALSKNSPLPCFGSQLQCNKYIKTYKKNNKSKFEKGKREREKEIKQMMIKEIYI
jgi:hypothetical protein